MVTSLANRAWCDYVQVLLRFRCFQPVGYVAYYILRLQGRPRHPFPGLDTKSIADFMAQETKQLTLEEIDLLFGERALGTLPDDLGEKQTHVLHEGA